MRKKCNEKGVQTAIMPSQVNNREESNCKPHFIFNDRGFSRLRLNNVIDRLTYLGTDSSGAPARAHRWGRGRCEASTDLDLRTAPNLLSRGTSPDPLCPRI